MVARGLSYHSADYWDERFSSDPREAGGFEWLSPSAPLLSHLPPSLLLRPSPPRILHIGVGTSSLSLDLLRFYRAHSPHDWTERARQIVNVDFSAKSIDFQREAERTFLKELGDDGEGLMQNHTLNLLNWQEVQSTLGEAEGFDVVLDKSTTDSISTGEDIEWDEILKRREDFDFHPALVELARDHKGREGGVATTQILSAHLGALVKRGGIWLCHSYSQGRFDDVIDSEEGWGWRVVGKTAVPIEATEVNAPSISHYIYTLHRT